MCADGSTENFNSTLTYPEMAGRREANSTCSEIWNTHHARFCQQQVQAIIISTGSHSICACGLHAGRYGGVQPCVDIIKQPLATPWYILACQSRSVVAVDDVLNLLARHMHKGQGA